MADYASSGAAAEILVTRRIEAIRKDGSIFPVSLSAAETIFEERHLFAYSIRDITKILNAEAELEKLSRELSRSNSELQQFAAIASHDLQAPLRTVASLANFLAGEIGESFPAHVRDRVTRIIKTTERMQKFIKNLLNLSRLNSAGPSFDSVNSNEIFHEVLSDLGVPISEARATVTCENLPVVFGDKQLVHQLFQNLIGNAIKFRKPNVAPIVRISCVEEIDKFTFSFRDNGIGVDSAHHNRIFNLFQKIHGASEYSGAGLGLAICKKIVELHGGILWIESQEGKGACFSFTIGNRPPHSPPSSAI